MIRGTIELSNDTAPSLWDIWEGNCTEFEIRAIDPISIASNFVRYEWLQFIYQNNDLRELNVN